MSIRADEEGDDSDIAEATKQHLQLFEELMDPNADPAWIRKGASGYDSLRV
jgi:hypothetical protein